MSLYECVFIARQDISAAQAEALAETFEQVIISNGGKIQKRESWGLRTLSFKIKKNRKGHYLLLNIDSPAPAVHEMERQMRIHEDILRYMTVSVDELEEGLSAVLRNKDRDDRPRRPGGDRDRGDRDRGDRDRGDRDRGDRGDRPRRDDEGSRRDMGGVA